MKDLLNIEAQNKYLMFCFTVFLFFTLSFHAHTRAPTSLFPQMPLMFMIRGRWCWFLSLISLINSLTRCQLLLDATPKGRKVYGVHCECSLALTRKKAIEKVCCTPTISNFSKTKHKKQRTSCCLSRNFSYVFKNRRNPRLTRFRVLSFSPFEVD